MTRTRLASAITLFIAFQATYIQAEPVELTPWGAQVSGNAEGTIPAYTGKITPPSSYDPASPGFRPDPFADEQPYLVIDASNYQEHAEHLSEGVKAMFERYPSFSMQVYPSHRTARYPDYLIERMNR